MIGPREIAVGVASIAAGLGFAGLAIVAGAIIAFANHVEPPLGE